MSHDETYTAHYTALRLALGDPDAVVEGRDTDGLLIKYRWPCGCSARSLDRIMCHRIRFCAGHEELNPG